MKPLAWYVNAAIRTLRAFVPALARPDDAFAEHWLPTAELSLYQQMDRRDRDHACRVARGLLAVQPGASERLVRAALLHDVGKADRPYRPWERIAVHVYRPRRGAGVGVGRAGLAAVWRHHQAHPARGAAMILAAGGDPEVAALVRAHHDLDGPRELELLRRVDART